MSTTDWNWNSWEWHSEPLASTALCAHCYQPLRSHAYAGVVKWRDRRLYAVGCLLDRLANMSAGD